MKTRGTFFCFCFTAVYRNSKGFFCTFTKIYVSMQSDTFQTRNIMSDLRLRAVLFWTLLFMAAVVTLPALGLAPFSTKGEPREAIVAMQMLDTGDWVLPIDNNGDIPYKPPMLYWCMAAASHIDAGSPEFSFRLPSALSLIALVCLTFWFTASFSPGDRRRRSINAFMAGAVLLTSSEALRAGINARVDMVTTLFIVAAVMAFYCWIERRNIWGAAGAVIAMSCAMLGKGPVGILLPAGITLVFGVWQGRGFVATGVRVVAASLTACILPLCWYYSAYERGGDAFLNLVMEENFGRMLGRMSYSSHYKGLWYYFAMLPAGLLPWTLLAVFALFSLKKFRPLKARVAGWGAGLRRMAPADRMALLAAVIVFVFYCIPKSKRGVYLLPIYPFAAYFIARMALWLCAESKRSIRVFAWILTVLSAVAGIIIAVVAFVPIGGKLAWFSLPFAAALPPLAIALAAGIAMRLRKAPSESPLLVSVVVTATLYLTYFAFINPVVAAAKSDFPKARAIEAVMRPGEMIYAHNPSRLDRWYSLTYFLRGRIVPLVPNANYSNVREPYDTPDEGARIDSLFATGMPRILYLTSASQRGSETLKSIARRADTTVLYESDIRSADLKERPVLYRLIPRKR